MASRQRAYWFIAVLLVTILAWILVYPDYIGICPTNGSDGYYRCVDKFTGIAEPSVGILSGLTLSFLVMLSANREVFRLWIKISIAYIAFAFLLVNATPEVGNPLQLEPDRSTLSFVLGAAFLLLSLFIIAYKKQQSSNKI